MSGAAPEPGGFVMRPSVALAIPYVYSATCLLIVALLVVKFAPSGEPLRVISGVQLTIISFLNAAFLAALIADGWAIRAWAPASRRGPLTGVVVGIVDIVLLQAGAVMAFDPLMWS